MLEARRATAALFVNDTLLLRPNWYGLQIERREGPIGRQP
jgi:hypothetical protein